MRVVSLTHPDFIRPYLETDRVWAGYALGDLDPHYGRHAEWYGADDDDGLRSIVLRYGGLPSGQLVFTMGETENYLCHLNSEILNRSRYDRRTSR